MNSDSTLTENLTSVLTSQTSVGSQPGHSFRTLVCCKCGNEVVVPIYCGDRFCSVCSWPRRLRVHHRLVYILTNITRKHNHGLSHLTLTTPNSPTVSAGFTHLLSSFRRLRSYRAWRNHVLGGAFVLEVTGKPGEWHCHLHIVIQNIYFPQALISKLWLKASGGTYVWIKRVGRADIVRYLIKYLSKSEVAPEHQQEAGAGLHGFRLFQPFGTWLKVAKGFKRSPSICKVCGQSSWLPVDLWYKHCCDYHNPPGGFYIKDEDRGDIGEPRESCYFTPELSLNADAPAPF